MVLVNLKELPMRGHYFFYYSALSGFLPFVGVLIKDRGISPAEVGLIYTVAPFFSAASKPIFGAVVDRSRQIKAVLFAFLLCITATFAVINFLPPVPGREASGEPALLRPIHLNLSDVGNGSYVIPLTRLNITLGESADETCNVSCSCLTDSDVCRQTTTNFSLDDDGENLRLQLLEPPLNETSCLIHCAEDKKAFAFGTVLTSLLFWLYCVSVTVNYAAIGCANSLTDAACFELLETENEDAKERFGRHRLWGTVGWGIFTAASGYVIDLLGKDSDAAVDYSAGLYICAALMAVDLVCVYACDIKKRNTSETIVKDLWKLVVRDSRIPVLLLDATVGGIFVGIVWQYHFWYLEHLGASAALMGASVAVRSFGELPIFFYAGWMIERMGHVFVLRMALLAMAATFGFYSVIVNPWITLVVEVLLGLALGAFFSALPSYAEEIAPQGTEATTMGLVMGFFEGIGTALGGMIGGAGFEWFGGRKTFQTVGSAGLAWCLIAYAMDGIVRIVASQRPRKGKLLVKSRFALQRNNGQWG